MRLSQSACAESPCAIITTAPNELVATIHDRMPVILTEHGERVWMDADAPAEEGVLVLEGGR